MVTVKNAHLREGEGGNFMSLELHGDVELVQSQITGRFYATVRRCFISSTFDEGTAKALIGTKFKGSIVRVETEAYDFTIPQTGEVIKLEHRWDYVPEEGAANIVFAKSSQPVMA